MKKHLVAFALSLAAIASNGQELKTSLDRAASDHLNNRFGAGVMVGEPMGLSLKYWLNEDFAVDGGLGSSFHRETGLQLHSDVLWHKFGLFDCPNGKLVPYLGLGGRVKFQDDSDEFGFRFPVGVSYLLHDRPIDVFFEVAPILTVTPTVRGDFNVAIGARFWF